MRRHDAWFLSLFALAYVYLDTRPAAGARPAPPAPGAGPGRAPAPARCPRDRGHPINLRADGALWCLACDEAFYPHPALWRSILGVPVAA